MNGKAANKLPEPALGHLLLMRQVVYKSLQFSPSLVIRLYHTLNLTENKMLIAKHVGHVLLCSQASYAGQHIT